MAACCDDMAASSAAFSYASESLLCSASAAESSSTSGCSSRAIHSRPSSSRCGRYSFRVIGSVRSSKRLLSTRSRALTAESCSMARTSRRHAEKRSSSICSTGFLVPLADGCLPATAVSMGDYVAHKQEDSDNALIVERGYNTTKKVEAKKKSRNSSRLHRLPLVAVVVRDRLARLRNSRGLPSFPSQSAKCNSSARRRRRQRHQSHSEPTRIAPSRANHLQHSARNLMRQQSQRPHLQAPDRQRRPRRAHRRLR